MRAEGTPVRLTLLTGFLGSGKTTWLSHQARNGVLAGATFVVNEAAQAPVDDAILGLPGLRVLAGGCACCDRRQDLLDLLRGLVTEGVSHLVLETSGLADPGAIAAAVSGDAALSGRLMLAETLVTIDAAQGLDLLRNERLARRQAAAADAIILTKPGLAPPGTLERLVATLPVLAPRAALFGAERGVETPLPEPGDLLPEPLPDAGDGDGAAAVQAVTLEVGAGTDWPAFALWLSALLHARGDDILRVKGILRFGDRRLLVQAARRAVEASELPPGAAGAEGQLVVIGRGITEDLLRRSLGTFAHRV